MRAIVSVLSILLWAASSARAASGESGRMVNAWQLLEVVETAYEQTHHAAQAGGLDPHERRFRPFWKAMDRAGRALEGVGTALRGRDQAFYTTLEQASTALGELRVLWLRAATPAPQVDARLRLLLRSFRLLRASYGAERLRSAGGGDLTPAEAESFAYLQLLHGQLAERLEALRTSSAALGDRAMAAEMARLKAESETIAAAEPSVDSYLSSRIASDEMAGEWEGDRAYAPAAEAALWETAGNTVEQLATDPAVGHVFALELGDLDDWSHLETTTFLPDEPEVEVFAPVQANEEEDLAAAGAEDDEVPGLFPPASGEVETAADPAAAPPAQVPPVELPPILAAILLWFALRFG